MKTPVAADTDLLFGLLALQFGLIDQGKLVAAFQAWTLEQRRPLAEHLIARGDIDEDDRAAVELATERSQAEAAAEAARRDRQLLDTLVDIRSAEADDRGGWGTDLAYADAFRVAGLDVAGRPAPEVAAAIRGQAATVALALAAAIDDWAAIRRGTGPARRPSQPWPEPSTLTTGATDCATPSNWQIARPAAPRSRGWPGPRGSTPSVPSVSTFWAGRSTMPATWPPQTRCSAVASSGTRTTSGSTTTWPAPS
jgi:hypothetical protein